MLLRAPPHIRSTFAPAAARTFVEHVRFAPHPLHKVSHFFIFEQAFDRRITRRQSALGKQCVQLPMADPMQRDSDATALGLLNQMVFVALSRRNRAST